MGSPSTTLRPKKYAQYPILLSLFSKNNPNLFHSTSYAGKKKKNTIHINTSICITTKHAEKQALSNLKDDSTFQHLANTSKTLWHMRKKTKNIIAVGTKCVSHAKKKTIAATGTK